MVNKMLGSNARLPTVPWRCCKGDSSPLGDTQPNMDVGVGQVCEIKEWGAADSDHKYGADIKLTAGHLLAGPHYLIL